MCIFSRPVENVSATKIFASQSGTEQSLIYSMDFSADEELAMILPIPVDTKRNDEDAVVFIDLSNYPTIFADIEAPFRMPMTRSISKSIGSSILAVRQVGDFDASYAPSQGDLSRLDSRFRVPENVWKKIPEYADYGFTVFKLNKERSKESGKFGLPQVAQRRGVVRNNKKTVHPMAFTFPTRYLNTVFFPTVHVHDGGTLPKVADFDHALYLQSNEASVDGFMRGAPAKDSVNLEKAQGLVGPGWLFKAELRGNYENRDILIKI